MPVGFECLFTDKKRLIMVRNYVFDCGDGAKSVSRSEYLEKLLVGKNVLMIFVRFHIGSRGERNILYKGVETSTRFKTVRVGDM